MSTMPRKKNDIVEGDVSEEIFELVGSFVSFVLSSLGVFPLFVAKR